MDTPEIYIWIGLPGSGRRKLLHDVTSTTRKPEDTTLFLISKQETDSETNFDGLHNATTRFFQWNANSFEMEDISEEPPSQIFWLLQGNANPVDQLEALKSWLEARGWPLTRIVTVVSARLIEEHPKLKAYYEACIHFSDMVLINQREGMPADWSRKFTQKYEKERYPCLFEAVKANRVKNPSLVLDPLPRRLSQYFDSLEEIQDSEISNDFEWEEDNDFEEEEEDPLPEDPFLARNQGGDRKFKIPDLRSIFP